MVSVWSPDRFSHDPTVRAGELTRLVMDRLRVAATRTVSGRVLADADLDMVADEQASWFTYHLTAQVLAERLGTHTEQATVRTPATWWDHWKDTHPWLHGASLRLMWSGKGWHHPRFGRWLTRWCWIRPPDFRTHRLKVTWTTWAAYPQATIPADDPVWGPQLGPPIIWRNQTCEGPDDRR